MRTSDPLALSAVQLARAVRNGAIDAREVALAYAQKIESLHQALNSHIAWDKETVLREAATQIIAIDAARKADKPLALAGVPIAIKDNIMVEGQIVSCASRMLADHKAVFDATVIQKLREAGALLFGRTNMDEFGMGSSTENSYYGTTLNPWNRQHVAGGSSGGSAAAVAAGMVPLALGSDTGGSIRQPASFCGVVGLKPSYGRVSRYGLIAYASSMDQIGPIGRTVADTALLYDVIAGHDAADSTSSPNSAPNILRTLDQPGSLKGLRIGVIEEFMGEGLDVEVMQEFEQALSVFRAAGAIVFRVHLPQIRLSIPVYYILATAEAASNLARYDGVRYGMRSHQPCQNLRDLYVSTRSEGFGREVKQRIMLGTYVLSSAQYEACYAKANRLREMIKREIQAVYASGIDILISPTAPSTAFQLGQKTQDSMSMYLGDIYTIAANLAGFPALSLPIGMDQKGLPVGLQLMAPHCGEEILLRSAFLYEQQLNDNQGFRLRI